MRWISPDGRVRGRSDVTQLIPLLDAIPCCLITQRQLGSLC
jgi:hypothetical protein